MHLIVMGFIMVGSLLLLLNEICGKANRKFDRTIRVRGIF